MADTENVSTYPLLSGLYIIIYNLALTNPGEK